MKPTYEELEAQVKQLAAENAALKLWASQSVELWDAGCDMDRHMRDAPRSVSTDAILASLRAEGVEMFAEHCQKRRSEMMKSEPNEAASNEAITAIRRAGEFALFFAAQLRSQSEQVKGVQS